jgi:pyridinium-3,5-biscarboxylic acid mononucleotide synthase
MNEEKLLAMLEEFRSGKINSEEIVSHLKGFPLETVGDFAHLDHQRSLRCGFPEVIYGEGKTAEQIIAISKRLLAQSDYLLITRLSAEMYQEIKPDLPEGIYHSQARIFNFFAGPATQAKPGIVVLTAGTTDIPVAEEAALTAEAMGNEVRRIFDVGVAGIHRLLAYVDELNQANVIVVAAGMEGALPSVVGGLVQAPVIALPTSVGYGASFHGLSALLGMLNSCANGVAVVNIDNGFGAGYMAALINRQSGK